MRVSRDFPILAVKQATGEVDMGFVDSASGPPFLYTLDAQGNARPTHDHQAWFTWRIQADMQVALDDVGPYRISTVFLGYDYGAGWSRKPRLFETMVMEPSREPMEVLFLNGAWRYANWSEAEWGHAEAIRRMEQVVAGTRAPDTWSDEVIWPDSFRPPEETP